MLSVNIETLQKAKLTVARVQKLEYIEIYINDSGNSEVFTRKSIELHTHTEC